MKSAETLSISIISDKDSWINYYLPELVCRLKQHHHRVFTTHRIEEIDEGDLLFILSFSEILPEEVLHRHKHNLVVHESDLPKGKGWSPLSWQVLEGRNNITISLFEATCQVDSGAIYLQDVIELDGSELIDEIRELQAEKTLNLCMNFIVEYPQSVLWGRIPDGEATYYRKRTPKDSLLDINKSIAEQLNLLRIVDNERYPAHFFYRGVKYIIKIYKEETN